jgi:hypothetical protein
MSRKFILTLATAATLAVSALATTAADAHGFGGGHGGGFGGGHGGFGGFGHGGFGGGHVSFGGGHGGFGGGFGGHGGGFGHGGFGHGGFGHGGFGGHGGFNHFGHDFGHGLRWAHWHFPRHEHWYWRDGRWIYNEGYDDSYREPVSYTQPSYSQPVSPPANTCNCLTKSYTQDGMVVFADLCTKESAVAPVGGRAAETPPEENYQQSRSSEDKASDATPPQNSSNFAGRTYKDFLTANGLPAQDSAEQADK